MRLFSQEIETWPCSVIGVLVLLKMDLLFGVMCRKNGKTITFFPLLLSVDGCEGIGTFEFVIESNLIFP